MKDQDKTKEHLIQELNELRDNAYAEKKTIAVKSELEKKLDEPILGKGQKSVEQFIIEQNQEIVDYLMDSRLFSPFPKRFIEQLIPLSELLEIPMENLFFLQH